MHDANQKARRGKVNVEARHERAVGREEAMALLDHLARTGPGGDGLMAVAVRGLVAEGVLDNRGLWDAYMRATVMMGEERASRVFLGEDASAQVEGALQAILKEISLNIEAERITETARRVEEMASRLGLDPDGIDVRMGEEGESRARAAGAEGVEEGRIIYLDERRFDPRSRKGQEVLGHEVAHVAQVEGGTIEAGPGAAEVEASRVGESLADGGEVARPQIALKPTAMAAHTAMKEARELLVQEERSTGIQGDVPHRVPGANLPTPPSEPSGNGLDGLVPRKEPPKKWKERNLSRIVPRKVASGAGAPEGSEGDVERESPFPKPVSPATERPENEVPAGKEPLGGEKSGTTEAAKQGGGLAATDLSGGGAGSQAALDRLVERAGQVGTGAERLNATEEQEVRKVEEAAQAQSHTAQSHEPSTQEVGEAEAAVEIPKEEVEGVEKGALAGQIVENPPPDAEIEKLCKKLRSEIGKRRPKDKEEFEQTDPQAMARAAGNVVAGDVGKEVQGTLAGYDRVNEPVQGEEPRPATPIPAPEEAPQAQDIGAKEAVPEPLKEEEVSLDAEKKDADQVWRDAQMETPEAQMVQEGPIAQAREAKEGFDRFAGERPKQALLTDAEIRKRAAAALMQAEQDALARMAGARQGGLQAVSERQETLRKGERLTREQVAARMQAIFEGARARVNAKLQGMVPAAMQQWQEGIRPLTENFRGHIDRVRRQIEERHEGVGGFFVGLWDNVVGLPDEITREYDRAEADFVNGACDLARSISSWVRGVTDECKAIIADARKEIDDYVAQLPEDLRKTAEEEKARIDGQFQELEGAVEAARTDFTKQLAKSLQSSTDEVRDELERLRDEAKGLLGKFKDFVSEFIADPLKAIVDGLLKVLGIEPSRFWGLVGKAWDAVKRCASDIVGFAGRVLSAVTTGFKQFGANILQHLQEGFLNWLFAKTGEAGIQIPKDFSLKGIFNLVLQVLGLGWQWIRGRLARLIGEKNVEMIEKAWGLIQTFVERGVEGIVEWIREKFDFKTLVTTILDAIKSFIIENVVKKAILWVVSLFNPASALLKAIELIYRVVTWIMDNASRIFALVEAVVNSMADIAAGNISKAASWVERALANFIPMVLDLLAKLLGLSALPKKVQEVIQKVQDRVHSAIDKALEWIVSKVKALWGKITGKGKGEAEGPEGGKEKDGEQEKAGPKVTFTVGGEQHSLWVERRGGNAVPMVASTPSAVKSKIEEWRPRLRELSDDQKKKAGSLIGKAIAIERQLATSGTQGKDSGAADEQVKARQEALADVLRQLFEIMGGGENTSENKDVAKGLDALKVSFQAGGEQHELWVDSESEDAFVASKNPGPVTAKVRQWEEDDKIPEDKRAEVRKLVRSAAGHTGHITRITKEFKALYNKEYPSADERKKALAGPEGKLGDQLHKLSEILARLYDLIGVDKDLELKIRQEYEVELGHFLYRHPRSIATAREMSLKAWTWMETAAEKWKSGEDALGDAGGDTTRKLEAIMQAAAHEGWKFGMGGAVDVSKNKNAVKSILTQPASLSEMMVHLDGFGRDVMGPMAMSRDSGEVRALFDAVNAAMTTMPQKLEEALKADLGEDGYARLVKQGGVKQAVQRLDVDFLLEARDRAVKAALAGGPRAGNDKLSPEEAKDKDRKKEFAGRSDDITMGAFKKAIDWKTGTGGWNWEKKVGVGGKDFAACKRRVLTCDFKDEALLRQVAGSMGVPDAATAPKDKVGEALLAMWTDESSAPPWVPASGAPPAFAMREIKEEDLPKEATLGKESLEAFKAKIKDNLAKDPNAKRVVTFLVGPKANVLNPDFQWVEYVRALNMPLRSGISGTTNRLLNTGKALGMTAVEVRLPVLGHLLEVEAHTYHEIMSAAASHGAPYTEGDYKKLQPLSWEGELKALWDNAEKKIKGGGKVGGTFS